jgi:endoglycosylceramidase
MVLRLAVAVALLITCCSTSGGKEDAPPIQEVLGDIGGDMSRPSDILATQDVASADIPESLLDSLADGPWQPDTQLDSGEDSLDLTGDGGDVIPEVMEPLPPYEPTEFVGTDGRNFRDAEGRVLILHGVNVSNVSKGAPFFPQWLTEEHVQMLADRGLNVVRLLVIWEAIEPAKGEFDQVYLDMIESRVEWFTSRGIYVLVDMHQDLFGPKFGGDGAPLWATLDHGIPFDPPPGDWFLKYGEAAVKQSFQSFWDNEEGIRDHFILAWQEVAKRFADNPMVVGYDIINEPYIGNWEVMQIPQFEAEVLTPFYAIVAQGIREVDENHIIFVEPTASKGLGIKGGIGPIGDDKVAYAAHYYHPTMDMLQFYSDSKENMAELFNQIREEAYAVGGPPFLGEFGFYAGFEGGELYAEHQTEVMEELNFSHSIWSFDRCNNGFCVVGSNMEPLWPLEYVTQTFPQRIAGQLLDWHYERPSRTLEMTFDPKGVESQETVIFVPARNYPIGAVAHCLTTGGTVCAADYQKAASRVVVTLEAGSEGPHKVIVNPATNYAAPQPGLSTHTSLSNVAAQEQELALEETLGTTIIRTDFRWSKIEPVEGEFDFAAYDGLVDNALSHGQEVVALLDYSQGWAEVEPDNTSTLDVTKFAAFAGATAAHFADRIERYEIWNEPNLQRFWKPDPNPAAYANLLVAASKAVRANDPSATVVFGGLASAEFMGTGSWPFLFDALHARADLGHYFDEMAIHPYTIAQALSPEQPNPVGTYEDMLVEARTVLAQFGLEAKPIVLTEMGWPACPCPPLEAPPLIPNVTWTQQAEYLVRAYLWSWSQGIHAFLWYDFYDGPGNAEIFSESYFGLVTYDANPSDEVLPELKPAYYAYQTLISLIANRTFGTATPQSEPCAHFTFPGPNDTLHVLWQWDELAIQCDVDESLSQGTVLNLFGEPLESIEPTGSPTYIITTP